MNNARIDTYHAINHLDYLLHDEQHPLTPVDRAEFLANFAVRANDQLFEIMSVSDDADYRKSSNHIAEKQDPDDCEEDVILILDLGECHPRLKVQDKNGMFPWGIVVHLCREEVRCYRPNTQHRHHIILDYDAAVSYIVTHLALQISAVIAGAKDELTKMRLAQILNHYARPTFQVRYCVGHGAFWYNNEVVSYAILSRDLEPQLAGFLGYSEKQYLFISDEVPEPYRVPQLCHEIIEEQEFTDQPARCVLATRREIVEFINAMDNPIDYLMYRYEFFNRLIAYYQANPKMIPDPDHIRRLTQSRDYLIELTSL